MKDTKDITGRDICIGDYIAYTTRQSSSMTTHIGRVESIDLDPTELNSKYGDPITVKVISVDEHAWKWIDGKFQQTTKVYRTKLTANKTIVILSHVPEHIREQVNKFRAR